MKTKQGQKNSLDTTVTPTGSKMCCKENSVLAVHCIGCIDARTAAGRQLPKFSVGLVFLALNRIG